ncbi:MAG TPA: hypothetical protein VJ672_06060 [Gemmatimonadaceae bacterium]|nr:hypothetical protein [Gemmatimonadaceae bacterium]
MSLRRLANLFFGAGLTLGAAAIVGYYFDLIPALPPSVLKLAIVKLAIIGALGLIGFGALLARIGSEKDRGIADPRETSQLPEPAPPLDVLERRERSHERERR